MTRHDSGSWDGTRNYWIVANFPLVQLSDEIKGKTERLKMKQVFKEKHNTSHHLQSHDKI